MKKFWQKIQETLAAVSFAEANEPEIAREVAGLTYQPQRSWQHAWNQTFAAAAFAEADCAEIAREFMAVKSRGSDERSLDTFLETVGLKGVRVCYVVARV